MVSASPPATGVGLDRDCPVPSPSWPKLFEPQQYAPPPVAIAQLCPPPALTLSKPSPPLTATGWSDRMSAQQYTALAEKRERSEEHTSELQSQSNLVCRLLLEK